MVVSTNFPNSPNRSKRQRCDNTQEVINNTELSNTRDQGDNNRELNQVSMPASNDCVMTIIQCIKRELELRKNNADANNANDANDAQNSNFSKELDDLTNTSVRMIVNNVPFVKMLASMPAQSSAVDIPIVTRQYEEQFMREAQSQSEASCIMKNDCECMFLNKKMPFVGMAFILPDSASGMSTHGNGMCILCMRKHTQLLFYKTLFQGHNPRLVIQRYGNICQVKGEYDVSAVLMCNPNGAVNCMPLPIVAHQRNRYTVHDVSGKKYIKQHGVYYEDFQTPLA